MLTSSLWDLSRKSVGEAELCWETTSILSNHLGPPLDFNTGQKNESRLGNLGAQNGLFLVFLCDYFLSSYCRKKK